jgi:hypothetical protein
MAGLLGGYRASLLPQVSTDAVAASGISPLPSFIIAALIAVGGVLLFQIKQRDFADLV